MRTTLESGEWIDHVPVQELKGGHKRKLDRAAKLALPAGVLGEDGSVDMDAITAGLDMFAFVTAKQDALWALLIDTWSYPFPVPELSFADPEQPVEGVEAFDEIPLDDYEAIEQALAPHAAKLARRPDPKTSTTSGSNGSSRASAARASRTG